MLKLDLQFFGPGIPFELYICTNDGSTYLCSADSSDGFPIEGSASVTLEISATGVIITLSDYPNVKTEYLYGGEKRFIGLATTANSTEVAYGYGTHTLSITYSTFYIVEAEPTFQIPVDAPEGARLLVKGTECKKDIDVIPVLQNKTITENGTYTAESGFAGFGEMIVDVPTPTPTTEKKTVTPSKSVQEIVPTNADYLSKVTVEAIPSEYEIPTYFNAETDIEVT